jgi:hypothetical protein
MTQLSIHLDIPQKKFNEDEVTAVFSVDEQEGVCST